MPEKSHSLRVLVVDDESLIRWSISTTLEDAGHAVTEADSAQAAAQAVGGAPEPFDVVLLDYRLPDSNDLNLLSTIRRLSPTSAVIMMTAYGSSEVIQGALALGAYRIVAKPFEVHDMAALVVQAYASTRG